MKFFVLSNPNVGRTSTATMFTPVDGSPTGEAVRCPVCGNFIGMLPLLSPVRVELETWGTQFADIGFGPGDEILVSERFWNFYRTAGLKGLVDVGSAEIVKLTAHGKMRQPMPHYLCCRAGRSRAAIDVVASGLERDKSQACDDCRQAGITKRLKQLVLESDSWSGEDIFFARGLPGTILVSQRFQELFEIHQFCNCSPTPAEQFSFDHYPWEKGDGFGARGIGDKRQGPGRV